MGAISAHRYTTDTRVHVARGYKNGNGFFGLLKIDLGQVTKNSDGYYLFLGFSPRCVQVLPV